jgi:two-component system sensor histidine kinase YesM
LMNIKKILNITLFFVLGMLTALLTFILVHFYTRSTYETLSEANTKQLQLISQKTDAMITSAETIARLLYQDESILGTILSSDLTGQNISSVNAGIDLLYTKYYSAFQQFGLSFDIVCLGENGFRYSSCGYTEKDFERLSSFSWYRKQRAYGNASYSVTNFVPSPKSGGNTYCYAIVRNVYQVSGDFAGAIIVFVDENTLSSIYSDSIRPDSTIHLLNEYSTVVSSNDKSKIGITPKSTPDYLFVRSSNPYDIYTNNYGVKCFCVKYTSTVTGWTIFEQIPLDSIMQPVRKIIYLIIAIVIGFYLLVLFVFSIITRSISRPIHAICEEMEHSISRNFAHLKIKTQLAEIKRIGDSYNHLCDAINVLIKDVQSAEKQANDAKFNFLKAQINPHFLYNTLFSIKCMVEMGNQKHASKMLTLLIALLQNSVSSNRSMNTLLEETAILRKYVQLQNLRYDNRIQFHTNLPEECMQLTVPRFLIQPLIENVFLHAVPLGNDRIELFIEFRPDGGKLLVHVCDTGIGFTQPELEDILAQPSASASSHIGLSNIQDRVQLLYGPEYGLSASCDSHFHTIVTLTLPLQKGDAKELVPNTDC